MACSEAEDAGGLAPAKDDNEAARFFIRRTLPILDCVDYIKLGAGLPVRQRRIDIGMLCTDPEDRSERIPVFITGG